MKNFILTRRLRTICPGGWRRGNILVLAAAMMVMIFAFTAFTVDVGYITLTKAQLQTASDASVLAAAQELAQGLGNGPEKTAAEVEVLGRQAAVEVAAAHKAGDVSSVYVDPSRDVRFGQVHWDSASNTWVKAWGVAPYNMVEVTLHRDQAEGAADGPLPLFFGPVIGHRHANLSTTATAAILPGGGFSIKPGSTQTLSILPIALDEETWNDLIMNGNSNLPNADGYSYNEDTGAVSTGSDGIKELNLYPGNDTTLPSGNRGTVDIGSGNNSTADLSRQIVYGMNESDLQALGFELTFENGPLDINGDTGISAGFKDELAAIKGLNRAIPVFTQVQGPGNNAMFTIVRFVGVRVMNVKLEGNPKRVVVQPAPFSSSTVTHDENATIEDSYIFTAPTLIR